MSDKEMTKIDHEQLKEIVKEILEETKCMEIKKLANVIKEVYGIEVDEKDIKALTYIYLDDFDFYRRGVYLATIGYKSIQDTICLKGEDPFFELEERLINRIKEIAREQVIWQIAAAYETILEQIGSTVIKRIEKLEKEVAKIRAELEEIKSKIKATFAREAGPDVVNDPRKVAKAVSKILKKLLITDDVILERLKECGYLADNLLDALTQFFSDRIGMKKEEAIRELEECLNISILLP